MSAWKELEKEVLEAAKGRPASEFEDILEDHIPAGTEALLQIMQTELYLMFEELEDPCIYKDPFAACYGAIKQRLHDLLSEQYGDSLPPEPDEEPEDTLWDSENSFPIEDFDL